MAEKRPTHLFRIYCFVCKEHLSYRRTNKGDAMKEFAACGHYDQKVKQLPRDPGRMRAADAPVPHKRLDRRERRR